MGRSFKTYKKISVLIVLLIASMMIWSLFPSTAQAESSRIEVVGKAYSFDKDNKYLISKAEAFALTDGTALTYGNFYIKTDVIEQTEKNGVASFLVKDDSLDFYYTYGDSKLNAPDTEWHLTSDNCSEIDGVKQPCKVQKGLIVLQTSIDKKNWITAKYIENAFDSTPIQNDAIYSATDVQLINGCYYRVIVAYELAKKVEDASWFQSITNQQEYERHAEVYEFYACNDSVKETAPSNTKRFSLGTKARTKNFAGYYGTQDIVSTDFHYGWDLGEFFISGHTSTTKDADGNTVFLKNVGDEVALWFNLRQNLNALNNNAKLSITNDKEWYDQYFETGKTDSGKGVLIIRQRDYENVLHDPVIYTNYLEANATVGADTKVKFFEEGDYEVALDYQITKDKLFDQSSHYRIFFKFSVRNGNCMVYPLDVGTGAELTNSALTENGFTLDMAKSRYLDISVKREILTETVDGLVEDTRFNKTVKDGDAFTEEGIYTITVSNQYTGQLTTKKIYVGTNLLLKAYMTTGLSIPEIKELVAQGATIDEMGVIHLASPGQSTENIGDSIPAMTQSDTRTTESQEVSENKDSDNKTPINPWPIIIAILGSLAVAGVVIVVLMKKKKTTAPTDSQNEEA